MPLASAHIQSRHYNTLSWPLRPVRATKYLPPQKVLLLWPPTRATISVPHQQQYPKRRQCGNAGLKPSSATAALGQLAARGRTGAASGQRGAQQLQQPRLTTPSVVVWLLVTLGSSPRRLLARPCRLQQPCPWRGAAACRGHAPGAGQQAPLLDLLYVSKQHRCRHQSERERRQQWRA